MRIDLSISEILSPEPVSREGALCREQRRLRQSLPPHWQSLHSRAPSRPSPLLRSLLSPWGYPISSHPVVFLCDPHLSVMVRAEHLPSETLPEQSVHGHVLDGPRFHYVDASRLHMDMHY